MARESVFHPAPSLSSRDPPKALKDDRKRWLASNPWWVSALLACLLLASVAVTRNVVRRSADLEKKLKQVSIAEVEAESRAQDLDSQLARRFQAEGETSEKVKKHFRATEERRKALTAELTKLEEQSEQLSQRDEALRRKVSDQAAALQTQKDEVKRLSEELSMEKYHSSSVEEEVTSVKEQEEKLEAQLSESKDTVRKANQDKAAAVLNATALQEELNGFEKKQKEMRDKAAEMEARAKKSERRLAREHNATANLQAGLDYQKRSMATMSKELASEQQALAEQRDARASDIKAALDRLQAAEATNSFLKNKISSDAGAAADAARAHDKEVQDLRAELERVRAEAAKAAGDMPQRLQSAEARAKELAERLALRQREDSVAEAAATRRAADMQARAEQQEKAHESDLKTISDLEAELIRYQQAGTSPRAASKVQTTQTLPTPSQKVSAQTIGQPGEDAKVQELRQHLSELEGSDLGTGHKRARVW